jgi:hypothetical protein
MRKGGKKMEEVNERCLNFVGRGINFFVCEGSQAVPARLSSEGTFQRG